MQEIMSSFTSGRVSDMDRLFYFSLLLTYMPVTESINKDESCLSQPDMKIWSKTGQSVVLKCTFSSHCSATDLHYEWFTFKSDGIHRVNLSSNSVKYSLDGASLHIKSLKDDDSGIYHCAAASRGDPAAGAQHVGLGTTLAVMAYRKTTLRPILWLLLVLLAIYSLALVVLIMKKYGYSVSSSRRMYKTGKKNSTKKVQFHDVLQEMYSKRNLERGKKTESRKHPQAEAGSNDDIYQNV